MFGDGGAPAFGAHFLRSTVNICIVLGRTGVGSQVLIDGQEITNAVRGLEVIAHVGAPTIVRLELLSTVELMADVDTVEMNKGGERNA